MRTIEPTEKVMLASSAISRAAADLLNSKHLYQSVVVQVRFEKPLVEVSRRGGAKERLRAAEEILDGWDWIAAMGDGVLTMDPGNLLPFNFPVVKAPCRACKDLTPFHLADKTFTAC